MAGVAGVVTGAVGRLLGVTGSRISDYAIPSRHPCVSWLYFPYSSPIVIVFGVMLILAQMAYLRHYYERRRKRQSDNKSDEPPVLSRFTRVAPHGLAGPAAKRAMELGFDGDVSGETLTSTPRRSRVEMDDDQARQSRTGLAEEYGDSGVVQEARERQSAEEPENDH